MWSWLLCIFKWKVLLFFYFWIFVDVFVRDNVKIKKKFYVKWKVLFILSYYCKNESLVFIYEKELIISFLI